MVALNPAYAPVKSTSRSKNRVGNFFVRSGDRVGLETPVSRLGIGEKYDATTRMASGHSKFANGAMSAAMVHLFNHESHALQRPGDGVGPIYDRDYNAEIETDMSADALFSELKSDINAFTDPSWSIVDSPFSAANGGAPVIEVGNVLNIDGPGPVNPQVMVTDVSSNSFTFTTVKGHPEAGIITFSVSQVSSSQVRFNINATFQASSQAYRVGYALGGKAYQTRLWKNTLRQGIKHSGGTGRITVTTTERNP